MTTAVANHKLESERGCPEIPTADGIASQPPPAAPRAPPKIGESREDYPHVVVVLDADTRIIECAARIQWILQTRRREGRHPWESVSFFRTKEILLHAGRNHPALLALPDRFPEVSP